MGKRNNHKSVHAQCPFYKDENNQMIRCEGFSAGVVLHVCFASASDCLSYKKEKCRHNYTDCLVAQMLGCDDDSD